MAFNAFGNDDAARQYQEVYHQPDHKGSLGHEAIAGAAGFAAMHAYEAHLRASGQEPSHPMMKQILAGIAAAEVDKLIETKGLNALDRHKAKKMAEEQAHSLAEQRYGGGTGFQYAQQQQGYAAPYNYGGGAPYGAQGCPSYGYAPPGGYAAPPQGYYPPPQGYAPPPQGYYPPPQGFAPAPQGNYPQGDDRHHHHDRHDRHHHHCD